MSRDVLFEYIRRLSDVQAAALAGNLGQLDTLVARLLVVAGSTFTHRLDYTGGSGLIKRLRDMGGPWGYVNPGITDECYPVDHAGIVEVRYRILSGEELKRGDGIVYRSDVETRFRAERMRFPDPAEALLPPAENHDLGRGGHPLVMFLRGSSDAFVVRELADERRLSIYSDRGYWFPRCDFLGVCE